MNRYFKQLERQNHDEWIAEYERNSGEDIMSLMASEKGGGDFKKVPEGTHIAVCNMVVDIGMQETNYGPKHKCYIRWELPNEEIEWTDKEGNEHKGPMTIGANYTVSLSEKANLRRDLEGWRGKAFTAEELAGFDVFNILGKACQVSVVHNESGGKVYANVSGVVALPKGVSAPELTNDPLKYSDDEPEMFDQLPDWIKEKLGNQVSATQADTSATNNKLDDFDDDIPF